MDIKVIPLNYILGKYLKNHEGISFLNYFFEILMNCNLTYLYDVEGWYRKYAGKYIECLHSHMSSADGSMSAYYTISCTFHLICFSNNSRLIYLYI